MAVPPEPDPPGSPAEAASAVCVEPSRIAESIRLIGEIGKDPVEGVSRVAFTRDEREAHALVAGWLRDFGLSVHQDAIGNTIGEWPGTEPGAPAIGIGSHLDSVPHGGRFDGIVGVVAGVEVIRWLIQANVTTRHPIRVVAFVAEEGARFGEPLIGSKAAAGLLTMPDLDRLRDVDGTTAAQALRALGLDPERIGECRWDPRQWAAFLELHIEQARVLEAEERQIGLVDAVSGSTRVRLVLAGRADHSGGTPMDLRADALNAAAEISLKAEAIARDARHRGTRATVGHLDVYPNSITTIPGRARLTLDVRDIDSDRQRQTTLDILDQAGQICSRRGISIEAELLADTSPAVLPMWLRDVMGAACRDLALTPRVMPSGAGHDAQIVNHVAPAGMIFVPSRDGLSHVPEEWTSVSDIARGIEVLFHSVLRLDAFLASIQPA
ncbi:MAG: allantoate amidohydrolase [Chloroflexota bacterium]